MKFLITSALVIGLAMAIQLQIEVTPPSESSPSEDTLPLPPLEETLAQALAQAERTLRETILSNAEISIVHHGASSVPLDDVDLEIGEQAIVNLYNLRLSTSPFHMLAVTPHLRLMSLELSSNVSKIEVTGNYTIAPEVMNYTSRDFMSSARGGLNLTFTNIEIAGTVGLNLNEHHLHVHTVNLIYRPHTVILRVNLKDGQGRDKIMEERRDEIKTSIEEPIYKDLAYHLNERLKVELNEILSNVSIPDLLENNIDTVVSFKTAANNHIGNINDFVDAILNGMKQNISDEIRIPDLERSFERKLGFIRFRGSFRAEEGWIKSLKTLHRTADVTLKKVNNTIEVSAALGLNTMEFGYNRYSAKFLRIGPRGILTASVGENSVSFRGRVGYENDNCTVSLEELKVKDLNNIQMTLTGLSPFNWILSKVATSIVNRSKNNIIKNIEETVGGKLHNQMQIFNCSTYFPKPAVSGT